MRDINIDAVGKLFAMPKTFESEDIRDIQVGTRNMVIEWLRNTECVISLPIAIQLRLLGFKV